MNTLLRLYLASQAYRGGGPAVPSIEFITNQDPLEQLQIKLTGMEGIISWGDTNETVVTTANQTYSHDYAGTGDYDVKIIGDIDNLILMNLANEPITPNVSTFPGLLSLESIYLGGTEAVGDFGFLSNSPSLAIVNFYNSDISGNISTFSTLTSLEQLNLAECANPSGDMSAFSSLSSLTILYLDKTSITGDVSDLITLSSLSHFSAINTAFAYVSTTFPFWDDVNIDIYNCNWPTADIDGFLNDIATSGSTRIDLILNGNNQARSSASDAAVNTIITNNGTVVVNE